MLAYKDKTFCTASVTGKCVNEQCYRFLTNIDKDIAQKMGLGISYSDYWDVCPDKKANTE